MVRKFDVPSKLASDRENYRAQGCYTPTKTSGLYYVSTYELAILYGFAVLNRGHFWKVCKSKHLEGVYSDILSLTQKSKPGSKSHLEQYKNMNEMYHHL